MTAREESLTAREMLLKPELLGVRLKERRWADVAALVRYAQQDVPPELAATDPALYRTLREGRDTLLPARRWALNLKNLEDLPAAAP